MPPINTFLPIGYLLPPAPATLDQLIVQDDSQNKLFILEADYNEGTFEVIASVSIGASTSGARAVTYDSASEVIYVAYDTRDLGYYRYNGTDTLVQINTEFAFGINPVNLLVDEHNPGYMYAPGASVGNETVWVLDIDTDPYDAALDAALTWTDDGFSSFFDFRRNATSEQRGDLFFAFPDGASDVGRVFTITGTTVSDEASLSSATGSGAIEPSTSWDIDTGTIATFNGTTLYVWSVDIATGAVTSHGSSTPTTGLSTFTICQFVQRDILAAVGRDGSAALRLVVFDLSDRDNPVVVSDAALPGFSALGNPPSTGLFANPYRRGHALVCSSVGTEWAGLVFDTDGSFEFAIPVTALAGFAANRQTSNASTWYLPEPIPAPPPAEFVDTFTDTNGTEILDHVPDVDTVGRGWVTTSTTSSSYQIQSNELVVTGLNVNGPVGVAWEALKPVQNFTITATMEAFANFYTNYSGVAFRGNMAYGSSGALNTFLVWVNIDTGTFNISKDAGAFTTLATTPFTVADTDELQFTVTVVGDDITARCVGPSDDETLNATDSQFQDSTSHMFHGLVVGGVFPSGEVIAKEYSFTENE